MVLSGLALCTPQLPPPKGVTPVTQGAEARQVRNTNPVQQSTTQCQTQAKATHTGTLLRVASFFSRSSSPRRCGGTCPHIGVPA